MPRVVNNMGYTGYTTSICGFNTVEVNPHLHYMHLHGQAFAVALEAYELWMKEHYIRIKHTGVCKPETVRKLAAQRGIVRALRAEAVSFDQSGKGRHIVRKIEI